MFENERWLAFLLGAALAAALFGWSGYMIGYGAKGRSVANALDHGKAYTYQRRSWVCERYAPNGIGANPPIGD